MKVISLFSGAGGMDLGFIWAGHKIVWANDVYEDAVETYKANIGKHIAPLDIKNVSSSDIPDCDAVIGGFPCQGFSVANWTRTISDRRNLLYTEMVRVVRDKQPKFFIGENVKGLLSAGKGEVLKCIIKDFEEVGYNVRHAVLNAADYGVPQKRQRLFLFGERRDIKHRRLFPPLPTHGDPLRNGDLFQENLLPWVPVKEAMRGIPNPDSAHNLPNHTYSKYKLRFNGYLGHRVVDPDKPAPTITARGDDKGGVVVIHHPSNKRRMSARELAAVQTFPLDFEFSGTRSSAYRQIANAVPPLLAKAIAQIFPKKVK